MITDEEIKKIFEWADEYSIQGKRYRNYKWGIDVEENEDIRNGIPRDKELLLKITHLNLYRNEIEYIPKEFAKLENIKVLYLVFNEIKEIKNIPKSVKKLYLNDNEIKEISEEVLELENLEILELSYNKIKEIKNIPKSVKELYLIYNGIEEISEEMLELENLEILYLGSNEIEEIKNLPKSVKKLYLNSNEIKEIKNIPKNTKELYLYYNEIEEISEEMLELENLEILELIDNEIKEIKNLPKNLKRLMVSDGVKIPKDLILQCPKIDLVEIRDNSTFYNVDGMDFYLVGEYKDIGILVRNKEINQLATPSKPNHKKPFKNFLYKGDK